jgi:hypothetical protein
MSAVVKNGRALLVVPGVGVGDSRRAGTSGTSLKFATRRTNGSWSDGGYGVRIK